MKSCFTRWRSAISRYDSDDSSIFEGANNGADALRKAAVRCTREQGPVGETQAAGRQQPVQPDSVTNFEKGNAQKLFQPAPDPPVNVKATPHLDVNSTKDERGDDEAGNHITDSARDTDYKEGGGEQFANSETQKGRNCERPGSVFQLQQQEQAKDEGVSYADAAQAAGDMSYRDFAHWRDDSQSLLSRLRSDEEEEDQGAESFFDEDAADDLLMNDMKEFENSRQGNEKTASRSAPPAIAASDDLHLHRHPNRPGRITRPVQPGANSPAVSYNDPYLELDAPPSQTYRSRTPQPATTNPDYSSTNIGADGDAIEILRPIQNRPIRQHSEGTILHRRHISTANSHNGASSKIAPAQKAAELSSDEENENMSREDVSFDVSEIRNQNNMKRMGHSTPKAGEAPVLDEQEMQRRLMDVDTNIFPSETNEHDVAAMSQSNPSSLNDQQDGAQNSEHERSQQRESKRDIGHQDTHHEEEEKHHEAETQQVQNSNNADSPRKLMTSPPPPGTPPVGDATGKDGWLPRRNSRARLSRVPSLTVEDTSPNDDPYSHSISSAIYRRRPHQPHVASRLSRRPSFASDTNTEATNSAENTGAVDNAAQSNGVASTDSSTTKSNRPVRPRGELTRVVSLSSIASGTSNFSDDNLYGTRRDFGTIPDMSFNLSTLDEEKDKETTNASALMRKQHNEGPDAGSSGDQMASPNTRSISDKTNGLLQYAAGRRLGADDKSQSQAATPASGMSPRFRENLNLSGSLSERRNVSGTNTLTFARNGKSLTLKEQSSTIDRLSKENFDLKMRIHFLNEALDKRSEEGIKEMISENVELKSDKLKLQKDNQALRRKVKELEESMVEKKDIQAEERDSEDEYDDHHDEEDDNDGDSGGSVDEELMYLRERIESYEYDVERLQNECILRESEKRRLAEIVKSLGDGRSVRGSEVLTREERIMWKDMVDSETAAKERADSENRRLREELLRYKGEPGSARSSRIGAHSVLSRSIVTEREINRPGRSGSNNSTSKDPFVSAEILLLRQENNELRREVSAQTSMLTSRNREKERLYQEIETLKLTQRRDSLRSGSGGDYERSISRFSGRERTYSRSSGNRPKSAAAQFHDYEKENLEMKNGELRDQVSALKLENKSVHEQLEAAQSQLDELIQQLENLDADYQEDVDAAEYEIKSLTEERDEALKALQARDIELQTTREDAQDEVDAVTQELEEKSLECDRLVQDVQAHTNDLERLREEMASANEGINRLEEDSRANLQKFKSVQGELNDANQELRVMEKTLAEANRKVERMTVQSESSQNEITFLREEQEGDKIKIGDLEAELETYKINLKSEKDGFLELEERLVEERQQREAVDNREKQEVQRLLNDLNRELTSAKEDTRKLKKNLSARDVEANTWKSRLLELEQSLRETLGDLSGSRSSLIMSIVKIQRELEQTALELENNRSQLDEKETLLRNRDALLESHALETRKLAGLLERERQAHRGDKHSFEQALRSHQQASRTITQNTSRISDLENARSVDRRRFGTLEQELKDQLSERNAMLLTLWKRLSAMCGPDWAHSNSLINGNLPSQEVIGNMLFWPGFSKNLLLAVKTLENLLNGFKGRVKAVDREMTRQYQSLEHNLTLRFKKLERLEEVATSIKIQMHQQQNHKSRASVPNAGLLSPAHDMTKLTSENKLLKAELHLLQSQTRSKSAAGSATSSSHGGNGGQTTPLAGSGLLPRYTNNPGLAEAARSSSVSETSSSPTKTTSEASSATTAPSSNMVLNSGFPSSDASNQRWIERLHELERRLKAEREARVMDRDGARRRLVESNTEKEELRVQLQHQEALATHTQGRQRFGDGQEKGLASPHGGMADRTNRRGRQETGLGIS